MDISYETNQCISLRNNEELGLSNYDLDGPFNYFIDDFDKEKEIILPSFENPVNISNNDTIIAMNKNKDFSQSPNTIDNSIKNLSGRKRKNPKKKGEKLHDKYSFDNILVKVNTHFLNFLIIFINEVLRNCNIDKKFYNINYQDKKSIAKKNFHIIKNETIANLLILKNDRKYKDYYHNKQLYFKISENSNNKIFNNILTKRYIDIFKSIYFNNKKNLIYEGMKLNLSQTFDHFFEEKVAKEDILYKKRVDKVIQKFFLFKPFIVKKYNN